MRYIDKLERKYGRFGISNLTAIIIGCYVVGYLLEVMQPQILPYLSLEPGLILRGQVWRLVTWLLIPPDSLDLFTIIMLFFLLFAGNHAGAYLGKIPLYAIYCVGINIYCDRCISALSDNGRRSYRSVQIHFYYLLYQFVHLSGICPFLSGNAGNAVFCTSH